VGPHLAGSIPGNQPGQGSAGEPGQGKFDDLGIRKQVTEEGLDGVE
jgi:hypothetical protein